MQIALVATVEPVSSHALHAKEKVTQLWPKRQWLNMLTAMLCRLCRKGEGIIAVAKAAGAKPVSSHAVHALQEGQGDAATANPGSAYGASALGPSVGGGGGGGAAPGTADAQAGTGVDLTSQQHAEDGEAAAVRQEQPGLSLPFPPVALVFKDIHYFVKRPDNKSEELELLKVNPCMGPVWLAALLVLNPSFSSFALPVLLDHFPAALRLFLFQSCATSFSLLRLQGQQPASTLCLTL